MARRIAIIQGHPDPAGGHLGHAIAEAYAEGALGAGHTVRTIAVASLDFPLLRSQADFEAGPVPPAIAGAQEVLAWADHWLIVHPLWLGEMPALLKAFLEQALRPGFAFRYRAKGLPERLMAGRSAHIIVTMGMPAFAYRWFFLAHGLRSLKRNILGFVGLGPIRDTLVGGVGGLSREQAGRLLAHIREAGARAR